MRVSRVDTEATDFLFRELVQVRGGVGRGAGVRAADVAVQSGEVEDVWGHRVDFDAGEGLVGGGVRGAVDFGGGRGREVEEAEGGVVRGGIEMGGVDRRELKGGDCSGV